MLKIIDSDNQAKKIAAQWDGIVNSQSQLPNGVGPTSLFDLAMLAKSVHAPDAVLCIYVSTEDGHIDALLPCYSRTRRMGPIEYTQVSLMSDLYPGRTGPLHRPNDLDALETLLAEVLTQSENRALLEISFVGGSESEDSFLRLVKELGIMVQLISNTPCPYICLPESYERLAESFSQKFKYNLRSREKKLRNSGTLTTHRFEKSTEVSDFLRFIRIVEQGSWKESAGTSLTKNPRQQTFHERMAPICAQQRILRGYIMFMDDEPIAHIIGLYAHSIFYCLKSSFVESYRKFSPGVILKALVLQELIPERARYWDFVGPAEDHKMQWTSDRYTLNKYAIYSNGLLGRFLSMRSDLSQRFRDIRQSILDGSTGSVV